MREVMQSIIDHLAVEIPAYFVDVPGAPNYPYALIWGTPGRVARETFTGLDDIGDLLGVTWVSLSTLGCLDAAANGRRILSGFTPASPASAAYAMQPLQLREGAGQDVQPDRDVKVPGHGHPYYAVDRYELVGFHP